uniref:Uncharacterized protein n=1 Tax=Geospiza parvula TaxID=87175 RepID=A0A8C3MZ62_GEOPR
LTTFPSLDLDRNKLRSITGISKLCNLKKLILSKNEFVDFPNEIQSLVCLERLELNQNQIRIIPEGVFSHLPRLKHLRLNNNRLCALPRDLAIILGSDWLRSPCCLWQPSVLLAKGTWCKCTRLGGHGNPWL